MQITLRQFLSCLALASIPASIVNVFGAYWFIPSVSENLPLTPDFLMFLFAAWLAAAIVFGLLGWYISYRRHFSWSRLAILPVAFSLLLLWPGITGKMEFTRTLPMPLALATLLIVAACLGRWFRHIATRKDGHATSAA